MRLKMHVLIILNFYNFLLSYQYTIHVSIFCNNHILINNYIIIYMYLFYNLERFASVFFSKKFYFYIFKKILYIIIVFVKFSVRDFFIHIYSIFSCFRLRRKILYIFQLYWIFNIKICKSIYEVKLI